MKRLMVRCWMPAALVLPGIAPAADNAGGTDLHITVSGLRNDKGVVQFCVAARGAGFPGCSGPGVVFGAARISTGKASTTFSDLPRGEYAVAVFHDANGNKRLDTFLGIPREGYGFSRNPEFKPRAPRFDEAAILLPQSTNTEIMVRYLF